MVVTGPGTGTVAGGVMVMTPVGQGPGPGGVRVMVLVGPDTGPVAVAVMTTGGVDPAPVVGVTVDLQHGGGTGTSSETAKAAVATPPDVASTPSNRAPAVQNPRRPRCRALSVSWGVMGKR